MNTAFKTVGLAVVLIVLVFGSAYFRWWRCGEMFPHAQFACSVGGR